MPKRVRKTDALIAGLRLPLLPGIVRPGLGPIPIMPMAQNGGLPMDVVIKKKRQMRRTRKLPRARKPKQKKITKAMIVGMGNAELAKIGLVKKFGILGRGRRKK